MSHEHLEWEEDGKPAEHVGGVGWGMDAEMHVAMQCRIKVSRQAVAKSSRLTCKPNMTSKQNRPPIVTTVYVRVVYRKCRLSVHDVV